MPEDEPEPGTNEYYQVPREVTQKECAACGKDHLMTYYPAAHPPNVGYKEIRGYRHQDADIIAAGICPNAEEVVFVYSEGWEKIDES